MPSTMSLLTMEASSTSTSLSNSILSYGSFISVCGPIACKGKPKNEWIVWPPAAMADIPVGASTRKFLLISSWMRLMKVVLPVPALPVMKREVLVLATKSKAFCCSTLFLSIWFFKVFILLIFLFVSILYDRIKPMVTKDRNVFAQINK